MKKRQVFLITEMNYIEKKRKCKQKRDKKSNKYRKLDTWEIKLVKKVIKKYKNNTEFAKGLKIWYNKTWSSKKESVYYFKKKAKILYERKL